MKKLYILCVGILAFAFIGNAQNVAVSGSDAATNAASPFATMAAAFTSINATSQTGNTIAISIIGNTSEPAAGAILNAGTWTAINIQPSGGAARTITGAATTYLIDLNGADNVTIDGLNTGGNALTISNTALGSSSAIRFFNDASNNFVQNSTILASTASSFGVIYFAGGTTTGNDNNNINNNIISAAGSNFPLNGIYSSGTSTSIDNSSNIINANNISDYFNAGSATNGIQLASTGNSTWAITNNKFFQSATRLYTSANTHNGINIQTGGGYTITGNTIGFANSSGTGSYNLVGNTVAIAGFPTSYLSTGTANATRFVGIACAFTAAAAVSEIQNNTIAGMAIYSSSGASTTSGVLCGISVSSGNANIGTTTGNTIGVATGTGSLYLSSSSAGAHIVGINAASSNTIMIQNNTIGGTESSGRTSSTAAGFVGIRVSGAGNFTVSSNLIGNTTANNIRTGYFFDGTNLGIGKAATTASGTSVVYGIDGTSSSTTGNSLSITSNTIRGIQISGSSTTLNGISTSGTMTGTTPSVNINSNLLGTATLDFVTYAFANSGTLTGLSVANTIATTININSNDIRGIVHSAVGSNTQTYISATGGTAASNITTIQNNTFTNLNVNTTGTVTFIAHGYIISSTGQLIFNNNSIVTAFNRSGASGSVLLTSSNSSSVTGSINNYTNNNFSNIVVAGTTTITGFNNTDGGTGSAKTITGNTFNNWTAISGSINTMNFNYWNGVSSLSNNTITNITGQSSVTGITMGATSNVATSVAVSGNTISNLTSTGVGGTVTGITCTNTSTLININNNIVTSLSSTGASAISGISIGGATTTNVLKNTICGLSGSNASSTVNGILVSSGTTVNLSNNRIADLTTPFANAANPLNGINITGGTTVNVYYNTVNINGTSSGALFGSSALSASSVPTVTLNNNILNNTSSTSGAGLSVAYRRSTSTLSTYGATSERNDFNASTIYTDGTTPQVTIAAYKTLVGPTRDANSISVLPTYLSSTCGNADFLKINTATASQLESSGVNISGITDDFENTVRQGNPGYATQTNGGGTAPDIGADEFDGIPAVVCSGTPASTTINGAASVCSNTGTSLSLNTTYTDLGITYQWASSTTMGGPYTTTLGTTATQATGNLTASTYYVCTITCSNSGLSYVTAEKAVTINALPMVAVSPTSGSICVPGGSPIALMASGALTYSWTPTAGLTPSTGANISANPSVSTTYTVTGTDANGCTNTAAATVNLENVPSAITIAPAAPTICAGDVQLLTATGGGPNDVIGSGTGFVGATSQPTAFCNRWAEYIGQQIYTAAEMIAAGYSAGNLTSLAFNVSSLGDAATNANYEILIGHVGSTSVFPTTSFLSTAGYTSVYGPVTHTHTASGWQTITFTTPFNWNGVDNICIDMKHDGADLTNNAQTQFTTTAGISTLHFTNSTPGATSTTGTTSTSRLNVRFTPTGSFPIVWSPTTNLYTDMAATTAYTGTATNVVYAKPASTITYIATATSGAGCTSTKDVVVTVSSGAAISTPPSANSKCAGQTATFTVVATGPSLMYQWRKDGTPLSNGGSISGATSATLTITGVVAGDAGNYDVIVTSTCGSPVTSTTALLTVNALPTAVVSPGGPVVICEPLTQLFTATTDIGTNYQWKKNEINIPAEISSTYNANSTGAYRVVISNGATGCKDSSNIVNLTVNPQPSAITLTPSSIARCPADPASLITATGGSLSNITILSENFNGSVPGWTAVNNSTGGTPSIAAWQLYLSAPLFQSNDNSNFILSDSDGQGLGSLTRTELRSPVMNLTNYTTANLNFWHHFDEFSSANDTAFVEVSINNTTWTEVKRYFTDQGTAASWVNDNISLNAYAGQATVYLRYRYKADFGFYWGIDNVLISGDQPVLVAWTPTSGLFTDAAGTVPYTGTSINVVYAAPSATQTYTFTATSASGCTRTSNVSVTVGPLAPTGASPQVFCSSIMPTLASIMITGTSIIWYDMASGGSVLPPTTPLVNGIHYYASQTLGGCESTSRLDVLANIEGLNVTSSANSGPGSLRSVVACAVDGNMITIDAAVATITMTQSLMLDKNLMIMDAMGGPVMITIDFAGITTYGFDIIAGKTVTLENLGLTAINNPSNYPLIQVDGTLNSKNVTTNQ